MEKLRRKINKIDSELINLLAKRREISREIICLKDENKSSIRDKSREEELLTKLIEQGKQAGLDSYFVTKVFNEVINDSVKLQNQIVLEKDNRELTGTTKVIAIQGIEGSYSYLASKKHLCFFSI